MPLLRLAREGGKGKEDDVRLCKACGGKRFGQEGEIAALVDQSLSAKERPVFRKDKGKIEELSSERPARLLRPAPQEVFLHAGAMSWASVS